MKFLMNQRRAASIGVALIGLIAFGLASPAQSASSIYNMDGLLAEPHPFAVTQVRPSAPLASPVAAPLIGPSGAPVAAPGAPDRDGDRGRSGESDVPDIEDLELDGGDEEIEETNDPLESVNRLAFAFNEFVNKYLLGPVAKGYNATLPDIVREAISNLLDNVSAPVTLANDLLQAEFGRGFTTATRIVINSTIGIGGFIDVAEKLGFEEHKEDFGQTLAVWGVGEGFYLVLPLLGPSNPRDALGRFFVDTYFDPLGYYLDEQDLDEVGYGLTALKGIVTYAGIVEELDRLRETSIDFYGTLRSLYRQRREAEINNRSDGGAPSLDTDIN